MYNHLHLASHRSLVNVPVAWRTSPTMHDVPTAATGLSTTEYGDQVHIRDRRVRLPVDVGDEGALRTVDAIRHVVHREFLPHRRQCWVVYAQPSHGNRVCVRRIYPWDAGTTPLRDLLHPSAVTGDTMSTVTSRIWDYRSHGEWCTFSSTVVRWYCSNS